jgi:preprotein translocase subunit SecE
VAEAEKEHKGEGRANWLTNAVSWTPRKFKELREFLTEVRSELKKVTWPSRQEVQTTTVVVVATTVFFGFYLWGLDIAFSRALAVVLKHN